MITKINKLYTRQIVKHSQECQRWEQYHQAWKLYMVRSDLDMETMEDCHNSSFF